MPVLPCLVLAVAALAQPAPHVMPKVAAPTPSVTQVAWQDLELGMFIHIAPQTWQNSEWDSGTTPLSDINPAQLDTDQWASVAKSMGAKYIVFVAKHEGGFCWWPTATTDYSVKNTPWRDGKGDVLADLSASCRREGLGLGVYLSPQDKHENVGVGGKARDSSHQADYERIFLSQLTEVLSNYGPMMEVWFDGSLIFDTGDILAKHAPGAVVFQGPHASIRWVGNEDGIAPYPAWNAVRSAVKRWGTYTAADGTPPGQGADRWLPNECDARIRATWFWNSTNENTLKSVDALMDMYDRSVGHGAGLLLNLTPDRSGRIPEADAKRAAEFGAAIRRRYSTSVASTSGVGTEFIVQPSAPATVDRATIMEDIIQGERVLGYSLEAEEGGTWKLIANGSAIGHKRIERFPPVQAERFRLRVLQSEGTPHIRTFAVHEAVGESR